MGRTGWFLLRFAILAGLGAGAYALAAGIDELRDGQRLSEWAAIEHVALYPIAAVLAGSLLTLPGLLLMYLGEAPRRPGRLRRRHRAS